MHKHDWLNCVHLTNSFSKLVSNVEAHWRPGWHFLADGEHASPEKPVSSCRNPEGSEFEVDGRAERYTTNTR